MKKIWKIVCKSLVSLISALLGAALIAAVVFGVMGYQMYRSAVAQQPLEDKVEEIRSTESFTSYQELPQIYIDAVISTEDRRFWSHSGVDVVALGRALYNDLRTWSFVEGGSTITQQLAKNLYFTQEKKLVRKFAEAFVSFQLEANYSKEEIFELYVNTIYFGSGYYGIRQAAQGYFGKEPAQLSDSEAVLLAGLPNAPSAYTPDTNPELAQQRMQQVINSMVANGALTRREADALLQPSA